MNMRESLKGVGIRLRHVERFFAAESRFGAHPILKASGAICKKYQ